MELCGDLGHEVSNADWPDFLVGLIHASCAIVSRNVGKDVGDPKALFAVEGCEITDSPEFHAGRRTAQHLEGE